MDFRQLSEIFDDTVLPDDYRTNLRSARERVAALKARVSANPQKEDIHGLLLTQAVYFCICGDFISANNYLTQLFDHAQSTSDSSLLARCSAYQVYLRCTKNVPPSLWFRIDTDTGTGVVRSVGVSPLRVRYLHQRKENRNKLASALEKFEEGVLCTYTKFPADLWMQAFPEHPQYFKDLPAVLYQEGMDYWENFKFNENAATFPSIAAYLNRMTLQYRLAGNDSNARGLLSSFSEDALSRGDLVAAAHCQLQLGDAILSPPFTSPLALNLVSVVREVGWDNDWWDKREQVFPLKRDAEAIQCYQQAHFLFEASASERGMAAVLLRYACVDIAVALLEPTQMDGKKAGDLMQSAFDHVTAAKKLFDGDITNSLILDGHLAICAILHGDLSLALQICYDVGIEARRTGNTCASEFVGMLLLRLARRLAVKEAPLQQTATLCACARACFKGLGDPYLELHAVAASARLHQRRGDIPLATKHVAIGRKLFGSIGAYFENLKAEVTGLRSSYGDLEQPYLDHDLDMLQSKYTQCMTDFDRLVSAVDSSKQNTNSASSHQPNQPDKSSSIVAMMQSLQLGGLDTSMKELWQALIGQAGSIDGLRQQYNDVIRLRRDELVINADIDAGETHLRDFLKTLGDCSIFSEELETMKTAIFQYLGDFNSARNTITRILPMSFGGTRGSSPEPKDASTLMHEMMAKAERQKFDRAVSLCFAAKDWNRGMLGVQNMLQQDPTILDGMKSADDPHVWYNMVWIACILEQNGDIGQAFEWYLNAFHVVEAHRQQLADIKDRRDIHATISSGELFLGMARIAFQFSQTFDGPCGPSQQWILASAEWKDQCLRFLELGRSRTLLDLLIVQKLAPHDIKDWSEYSYQLRLKETLSSTEDTAETKSQDGADNEPESQEKYLERIYDELMTELKSPSLSKLLPEPAIIRESNEKLYQCIPETAIVLHISSGREGLMILCITAQGIIDIHTVEMTDLELDRHIFRFAKLFRDVKSLEPSSLPSIPTCDQYLKAISGVIIEPVAQHIKTKEHVIFIPSPSLNKFPLCALIYNEEPLFLSKDVSQLPSLSVLQYLADKKHLSQKKVSVIYKDPDPTRDNTLDLSTAAAINIARSFHAKPQAATETLTQDNFIEMYEQSDVLLIATHGTQSTKSAWESSLLLHPPFRVLDLAKLRSNASLIIFEACVSGLGEESIGDDLLGFSHAVLASGATAFLGGLWKVSDEASALLMLFLFEEFKTDKGSKSLARCWRNAQKRLYGLDVAEAVAIFEDMRKDCVEAYKARLIDKELAAQLRWTLQIVTGDLRRSGACFKHPFYWAPFVLMGHAGLTLEPRLQVAVEKSVSWHDSGIAASDQTSDDQQPGNQVEQRADVNTTTTDRWSTSDFTEALPSTTPSQNRRETSPGCLGGDKSNLAEDEPETEAEANAELDAGASVKSSDDVPSLKSSLPANLVDLVALLEQDFDKVAQEFIWTLDLRDCGLSTEDIAETLLQALDISPWLSCQKPESSAPISARLKTEFHQPTCAHRLESKEKAWARSSDVSIYGYQSVHESVIWRCGLAGVFPPTQDTPGVRVVTFSNSNSNAEIFLNLDASDAHAMLHSPNDFSKNEQWRALSQITTGMLDALVELQAKGGCCDRISLLTKSAGKPLELKTLSFSDLKSSSKILLLSGGDVEILPHILASLFRDEVLKLESSIPSFRANILSRRDKQLHWIVLTAQLLNLAVALYSQSHVGEFYPPFLKNPLIRITLRGCLKSEPYIVAQLKKLACLGSMIGDKVFAFSLHLPRFEEESDTEEACWISGTCEDIVDTWGPGSIIAEPTTEPGQKIYGLRIGGDIIAPSRTPERVSLFHWSPNLLSFSLGGETFGYRQKIIIGAVKINTKCPLDEEESRRLSAASLSPCGTEPSMWVLDEKQALLQGGQYVQLSVGNVYHKIPKRTLKSWLLDNWASLEDLRIFNYFFGVQVSLCTGVARRVPLRALIEEPLLQFVDSLRISGWPALRRDAKVAFAAETAQFNAWLDSLSDTEHHTLQAVCGKLLELLKDTGFDRKGCTMRILWPAKANPYLCVRAVPDRGAWTPILKDSEWCATFAVATCLCLETEEQHCRAVRTAPWGGAGAVLSTAVCPSGAEQQHADIVVPHALTSTTVNVGAAWALEDRASYWMGEAGGETWVLVRKTPTAMAQLLVRQNRFPRFVARRMWQGRILRERTDVTFSAEEVFVGYVKELVKK
ncbi:hypothetical protein H2198_001263 [Neophaeococcomyces mojaviensis]|uniref:Uncharacterized protein n=1 Tax=Neophaeococcomyces mojaviensis TaxID=3383035 RepID=A0ACC3AHA7_9EURO|nr:hypothetical protein H2198_001263 [Knufia sp. JES_112]